MTRRDVAVAALMVVVVGCGAGRTATSEPAQPTVVRIAVAAQAATPSTGTTGLVAAPAPAPAPAPDTTTTTAPSPATVEPPMPYGAYHGDQAEIVDEFAAIEQKTDCDALLERQASYEEDEKAMLATRAEQGHRAKAEHDDRWADAVNHRLVQLGCVDLAGTP